MQPGKLVLCILAIAALLACGRRVWNELDIDRCPDQGGRWHAERKLCEGAHAE